MNLEKGWCIIEGVYDKLHTFDALLRPLGLPCTHIFFIMNRKFSMIEAIAVRHDSLSRLLRERIKAAVDRPVLLNDETKFKNG